MSVEKENDDDDDDDDDDDLESESVSHAACALSPKSGPKTDVQVVSIICASSNLSCPQEDDVE